MIEAVIFDFDGVVVMTKPRRIIVIRKILDEAGLIERQATD